MTTTLVLLVKVTLLAAAALLILRALQRVNPRWRMLVAEVAGVTLLLLPLVSLLPIRIAIETPAVLEQSSAAPIAALSKAADTALPSTMSEPVAEQARGSSAVAAGPVAPLSARFVLDGTLSVGYALGLLILLSRVWSCRRRLHRELPLLAEPSGDVRQLFSELVAEYGISRRASLRVSTGKESPFCCAVSGGTVVVPRSLLESGQREALEMVLRHELHHLSNRDLRRSALMNVVHTLFWFHPLVWMLRRSHGVALEELGDRVAAAGGVGRERYRKLLAGLTLEMQGGAAPGPLVLGMFGAPQVMVRLRRLGTATAHRPLHLFSRLGAILGVALPLLFVVGALELAPAHVPKPSTSSEAPLLWLDDVDAKEQERSRALIAQAFETLGRMQHADGSLPRKGDLPKDELAAGGFDLAATALLGGCYLGHGGADVDSSYREPMLRALDYVLSCQQENGEFSRALGKGSGSMYEQAIGTWFVACVRNAAPVDRLPAIDDALVRAVDVMLRAQAVKKNASSQGGWRYTVNSRDSDLSVSCWVLRALYAANGAGVKMDSNVFSDALSYIRDMQLEDGGFAYTPGGGQSGVPRTAMALFCLQKSGNSFAKEKDLATAYLLKHSTEPQKNYANYAVLWGGGAMRLRGGKDFARYADWMVTFCNRTGVDAGWQGPYGDCLETTFVLLGYAAPDA